MEFQNYLNKLIQASQLLKKTQDNIIVFDIDDTLLIPETGMPIKPTVDFYNWVRSKGFIPVIVTARENNPSNVEYTINQLKSIGIVGFDYIYFRPYYETNLANYKEKCREDITQLLGNIVMSIGDKPWDYGKFGGFGVLLQK